MWLIMRGYISDIDVVVLGSIWHKPNFRWRHLYEMKDGSF